MNIKKLFKNIELKDGVFFLTFTIVAAGLIGFTYYSGFTKGFSQTKIIKVEGVISLNEQPADFSTFWIAWNTLKLKYFSKEDVSDNNKLLYGAINGMFESVGDPHTTFFPPQEAKNFGDDISGEFQGIGAEIGFNEDNELVVIAPLQDTPAFKAGLEAGDKIIKIDGEDTAGLTLEQDVEKIRGEEGTEVILTIERGEDTEKKDIYIIRDVVQIPSIEYRRLNSDGEVSDDGDIAYIRLYNFYGKTYSLFYKAAIKMASDMPKGIIIDLRNNPGGYLDSAVSISGWFVKNGDVVVKEEFQDNNKNKIFTSRGPAVFKDIPIVVIINKGSASASEILAGALGEQNDATIVGQTSFGKGTVQEVIPMPDKSLAKITVAHWLTPSGHSINKNGINPDIIIDNGDSTETVDTVFNKSILILLKKIN